MKKLISVFALSLLISSSAFAIVDDGISSLGCYFDQAGDVNCFAPTAYTPFTVYFIMANPDLDNLGGFEFAWGFEPAIIPAPFVLGTALPQGALNIGTTYNLVVGLGAGLIASEATVLVSFNMMVLAPVDPATYITAGPATPDSIDGEAAYNDFNNPSDIRVMNWATVDGPEDRNEQGWVVPGLARLSCDGPVATETQTWGTLKALFE